MPLILNAERFHGDYVATSNPVRIKHNVRFLVNLDTLDDPEDLLSDDLGSWSQTKTKKKWYNVKHESGGKVMKINRVKDGSLDAYKVCRRPFVNCSDPNFHKTIVDITHPDGKHHNVVFVKYEFDGVPEHAITVKKHGNAKSCSIPYLRTYKSTRKCLEQSVKRSGTGLKRAVHEIESEVGGLGNCNSVGALPRNERQAKYLKEKDGKGRILDPILAITERMKTEDQKFIRCYSLDDDSPKVVLFTDDQADDLINFCCNKVEGHNSLLYVDVTFELGPFFVLVTTYRNPPTCPVMLGPVMLCMLKDKATYLTLFQKLTADAPGLQTHLQGYSTDSEQALRQTLAQVFPSSVSLLCKIHAQKNIEDKCRSLRLSQSLTQDIVNDIFASGGLVYTKSSQEYHSTLDRLADKWDEQEFKDTQRPPNFSKYFRRHKAEDIWNHVSAKASRDAGFGDKVQTNNIPKSANVFIKRWQDFQPTDMANFINDLKGLVNKQRNDVQRAFLGLPGPYMVRPEYETYIQNNADFFDAQPGTRKSFKVLVDPTGYKRVCSYQPAPPQQASQAVKTPGNKINLQELEDFFPFSD